MRRGVSRWSDCCRLPGYRVTLYHSAETFLETARSDACGCILLDLRMPGLTGLQLQQRLVELRHRLPIIFLSGHGDISTSVLAMKSGAEDFLTKPVDTDVLLKAVERATLRAIDRKETRAGAGSSTPCDPASTA